MDKEIKHMHAGHRQRLKNKVKKKDLSTLEDHEIVELLLTYTIPRKDTNPIAHKLLSTFDSLDKVIDANFNDLQKVQGVGEETALFFKVISQLFAVYKERKGRVDEKLTNTQMCVNYFRKRYVVENNESMLVLCVSKTGNVVGSFDVKGNTDTNVDIDIKSFVDKINMHNTSGIVLFHTHPHGSPAPSQEDIEATQKLYNICAVMGIKLVDHIIVSKTEHYSFAKEIGFYEMEQNCKNLLNVKVQSKTNKK